MLADQADNRILECAFAGHTDIVVPGDRAMLELESFEGIQLVTLRESVDHE